MNRSKRQPGPEISFRVIRSPAVVASVRALAAQMMPQAPKPTRRQSAVMVPMAVDETWQAEYWLVRQGRELALAEIRVRVRPDALLPSGGLSAQVLRKVRIGDYVNHMNAAREAFGFLEPKPMATPPGPRRGRPRLRDDLLLAAAAAYADAVARGSERAVLEAAEKIGETAARMRDQLHRARVRGFLTRAIPGRAGGTLTPNAKALLRRAAKKQGKRT
jgi:hypothetical protein